MSDNRTLTLINLPEDIFIKSMPEAELSTKELTDFYKKLSITCKKFSFLFKEPLQHLALKKLLHAVIDNDQITVKRILNCKLEILLITPLPKWVITSQLTGYEYFAKDPLRMACELRQTNMVKLLISYYDKMAANQIIINKKSEALAAWPLYQIEKNHRNEEDEIIIPDEYLSCIESLMQIFLKGVINEEYDVERKEAVLALAEKLQKNQFDSELLLLAVYKVFRHMYFNIYNDGMRFDVEYFCAHVMCKIQAAVLPDIAKILCLGLDKVNEAFSQGKKLTITPAAKKYQMKNGLLFPMSVINKAYDRSFYCQLSDPDDKRLKLKKSGFFCGLSGEITLNISRIHFAYNIFHHYLKRKQQRFLKLCKKSAAVPQSILPSMKL